jgi:hypothetical protein
MGFAGNTGNARARWARMVDHDMSRTIFPCPPFTPAFCEVWRKMPGKTMSELVFGDQLMPSGLRPPVISVPLPALSEAIEYLLSKGKSNAGRDR